MKKKTALLLSSLFALVILAAPFLSTSQERRIDDEDDADISQMASLPQTWVTSPSEGTLVNATGTPLLASMTFTAEGRKAILYPQSNVTRVEFYLHPVGQTESTLIGTSYVAPYQAQMSLSPGLYVIYTRVFDDGGRSSKSQGITFIINSPPVISSFTTGKTTYIAPERINLIATAADPDAGDTVINTHFSRTNGSATGLPFTLNADSPIRQQLDKLSNIWRYTLPSTEVIGTYDLRAVSTDNHNAVSNPANVTVTVQAPDLTKVPESISISGPTVPNLTAITIIGRTTGNYAYAVRLRMNGQIVPVSNCNYGGADENVFTCDISNLTAGSLYEFQAEFVNGSTQVKSNIFRYMPASSAAINQRTIPTQPSGQTVGTVAGSHGVSESGAATYSIPIVVPPGVAGMAPSLAFTYNSQGGNGLMGVGWSLSGLSSINRCPKNYYQDNLKGKVGNNSEDGFCLDGQRLIKVGTFTDTEDGVSRIGDEYRTERDSYSRIVSFNANEMNPAFATKMLGPVTFKVWTKSGQIMYYGWDGVDRGERWNEYDSILMFRSFSNSTSGIATSAYPFSSTGISSFQIVRAWALKRVQDRKSNYLTVTYEKNACTDGAQNCVTPVGSQVALDLWDYWQRPKRIDYSGNGANLPIASVRFGYEQRITTDFFSGADSGGGKSKLDFRLATVTTHGSVSDNDPAIRKYRVNYEPEGASKTGRTRVLSIRELSGDEQLWYPETSFTWSDTTSANMSFGALGTGAYADFPNRVTRKNSVVVDLDGDGRSDIIKPAQSYAAGQTSSIWDACISIAGPSGAASCTQWTSGPRAIGNSRDDVLRFADFDGDGRADLVYLVDGLGTFNLQLSTGTNFSTQVFATTATNWKGALNPSTEPYPYLIGDFDGDGRSDLALYNGVNSPPQPTDGWIICSFRNGAFQCMPGVNVPPAPQPYGSADAAKDYQVGDFNGDGRADFAFHVNNSNRWRVCLSTSATPGNYSFDCYFNAQGVGEEQQKSVEAIAGNAYDLHVADVNGDGMADLVMPKGLGDPSWRVCLSQGDKTFKCADWAAIGAERENSTLGDFNGDGRTDLAIRTGGQQFQICLSTGIGFNCGGGVVWPGPTVWDKLENIRLGDFDGDGKTDIAAWSDQNGPGDANPFQWNIGRAGGIMPDQLLEVTNGLGAKVRFKYAALTDSTVLEPQQRPVYLKGSGGQYPVMDVQSPMYVVSKLETDRGTRTAGVVDYYATNFFYDGLKAHVQGGGLLGFAMRHVDDSQSMVRTTTTYLQDAGNRMQGLPLVVSKKAGLGSGVELNRVVNTWDKNLKTFALPSGTATIYQVHNVGSVESSYEVTGTKVFETTTTKPISGIDEWGNVSSVTVKTTHGPTNTDEYSKVTTSTYYDSDTSDPNGWRNKWILGRLKTTSVQSKTPFQPDVGIRNASFGYEASSGLLNEEIVEPQAGDGSPFWLRTFYVLDQFGNRAETRVYGSGIENTSGLGYRKSVVAYDSTGRFPASTTNPVGHVQEFFYDSRFGTVTQHIVRMPGNQPGEAAGQSVLTEYDRLGRKLTEYSSLGGQTDYLYQIAQVGGVGAVMTVTTSGPSMPTSRTHFDVLGREVLKDVEVMDSAATVQLSYTRTQYDDRGRKWRASRPFFGGNGDYMQVNGTLISELVYENGPVDRVVAEVQKEVSGQSLITLDTIRYEYSGATTTTKRNPVGDPAGDPSQRNQVTSKTVNGQGQVIQMTDALGNVTLFKYDPYGNLNRVEKPLNRVVTMSYDVRGRKTGMSDPDTGSYSYTFNSAGEMLTQTDARQWTTTMTYDAIGRMKTRVDGGPNPRPMTASWVYDTCRATRLCSDQSTANGLTTNRTYKYDVAGRMTESSVSVETSGYLKQYFTTQLYDSMSRVQQVNNPGTGLVFKYNYHPKGFMTSITEPTTSGFVTHWQATSREADGQIRRQLLKSSHEILRSYDSRGRTIGIQTKPLLGGLDLQATTYAFDNLGNLTSRTGTPSGTESFCYDKLNRLTHYSACPNGSAPTEGNANITYDEFGNFKNKSGAAYGYFANNSNQLNTAGGIGYSYDLNGNVVSNTDLALKLEIDYNGFNLPDRIKRGTNVTLFGHNASQQRQFEDINGTKRTWYIGGTEVIETRANTSAAWKTTEWRHYFGSPEGTVGFVQLQVGIAPTTRYFLKDLVGSTQFVMNEGGGLQETLRYDPWGKRLDTSSGAPLPLGTVPTSTDRGYTGHEHLDEVGLIHMNGRIYDPTLGRFLQPDPIIQSPYDLQNYNRYSYVMNNPLIYTDPTGFSWWTDNGRPVLRAATAIYVGWALGPAGLWKSVGGVWGAATGVAAGTAGAGTAFASAITAGFAAGGIGGGNLKSALNGAFSAALFFGVGQADFLGAEGGAGRIAGHALAGCASSAAGGGSCGQGALAAGFAEFAGPRIDVGDSVAANIAKHAVLGGIASAMGGGKFANGALGGAFGYLFNHCSDGVCINDSGKESPCGGICTPEMEMGNNYGTERGDKAALIATVGLAVGPTAYGAGVVAVEAIGLKMAAANLARSAVGAEAPEFAMLSRYASGLRTSWDRQFIRHEATELALSLSGKSQTAIHNLALRIHGVTTGPLAQARIYHPEVVRKFSDFFNLATKKAAGL